MQVWLPVVPVVPNFLTIANVWRKCWGTCHFVCLLFVCLCFLYVYIWNVVHSQRKKTVIHASLGGGENPGEVRIKGGIEAIQWSLAAIILMGGFKVSFQDWYLVEYSMVIFQPATCNWHKEPHHQPGQDHKCQLSGMMINKSQKQFPQFSWR